MNRGLSLKSASGRAPTEPKKPTPVNLCISCNAEIDDSQIWCDDCYLDYLVLNAANEGRD